ncbi:phage tail tape measure protein [Pseudochelatococcus sp. G4_1912]|uniref:phage tail tape measure protein n=1 Tax=Pseudochelatococcus sp. G4_1912 TaxID=3114288 RepID=UPI0039C5C7D1
MAVLTSKLIVSLVDQVTAPMRGINAALKGVQDRIKANNAQMDAIRGRMVEAAAVSYALARAISAPVKSAMEFESAMADVKKVVNFDTPAEFKQFSKDVTDLSERIPMASKELTQIVAAAGQSGIPKDQLLEFTEMAAKVGVAFEISASEAGESLAKMMTGLNLSIAGVSALSDSMNHLSDKGPAAAKDVLDVVRRVGAQGKQFGFTATQVAAFGAAMLGAGAKSDVAATSFNNMGRALVRGGNATKAQRQALGTLGIDSVKLAKAMQKDAVKSTVTVLERINKLPAYMRGSIVSQLFGDEAHALGPIITNLDLLKENLGYVANETNYIGSAEREYQSRAETTENALQRLINTFGNLSKAIGDTLLPIINNTSKGLIPLIHQVREFVEANGKLVRSVIFGVGGLVAFRVAAIAAQWGLLFLKGGLLQVASIGLMASRGILAIGGAVVSLGRMLLAVTFGPIIAGFRGLALAAASFSFVASGLGTGTALSMLGRNLLALLNPMALVRGALIAMRVALISTGIGAIAAAVAAAGVWIYNNWSGLVTFFEGFGTGLKAALTPVMPAIQPIIDGVSWLWDKFSGLTGEVRANGDQWRSWGENIGTVVGGAIMGVIEKFQTLVGWISKALEGARGIGSAVSSWFSGSGQAAAVPGVTPQGEQAISGARASGGPVAAGGTYLVGERGPELFAPERDGFILPARITRLLKSTAALGAAAYAVPAAATPNLDAYTLPEPVVQAIMQSGYQTPTAGASAPQTTRPSVNQTNHIQITISGANGIDPESIAREIGNKVSQRLEGALFDYD